MSLSLKSFTEVLEKVLDVLEIKDSEKRQTMVADVLVYLLATALNEISEKYLSEDGKKRLDEILKFDSAPDQKVLEEKWNEAMRIIDEEVAGKNITDDIEETLKKALADYMQAITENATEKQKKKLAELFEKQV